jgi:hypothetical protein
MKVRLFRDTNGYTRAETAPFYEALGRFLEEDVQNNVNWIEELLYIINELETGSVTEWEGTGNASTLSLTDQSARITHEFDDSIPPCEISLQELRQILLDWRTLISQ